MHALYVHHITLTWFKPLLTTPSNDDQSIRQCYHLIHASSHGHHMMPYIEWSKPTCFVCMLQGIVISSRPAYILVGYLMYPPLVIRLILHHWQVLEQPLHWGAACTKGRLPMICIRYADADLCLISTYFYHPELAHSQQHTARCLLSLPVDHRSHACQKQSLKHSMDGLSRLLLDSPIHDRQVPLQASVNQENPPCISP